VPKPHGLKPFFEPTSLAIIGASANPLRVGHVIAENMVNNQKQGLFRGKVFLVNPKHDEILGEKCYPSVSKIPNAAELIVVAVPAPQVPGVIEEAGGGGTKAAIVVSAGFAEVGNLDLEKRLIEAGKKFGVRIIGPNCLGVYDAYTGVNTLFLPETKFLSDGRLVIASPKPRAGPTTLLTQSGAFGSAALDYMAGHAMGIRGFVSYGNRCDVREDELIHYFGDDEKTKVILLYVEGLANGRAFFERAKETTVKKPIVAMKAGRTQAGTRAAMSHTAALAGSDQIYEGVFRQTGIIRARTVEELFDFARAFALQPPGYSKNVAILTNAGGPAIMATDALEESGLEVKELSDQTFAKISDLKNKGLLLPIVAGRNPIDLTAEATPQMYNLALSCLLEDPLVGGVVLFVQHQAPTILDDVIPVVTKTVSYYGKPVTVCDMGGAEMAETMRSAFEKQGLPAYSMPERAARAIWALVSYGCYLNARKT